MADVVMNVVNEQGVVSRNFVSPRTRIMITILVRRFAAEVCAMFHLTAGIHTRINRIPGSNENRTAKHAFLRSNSTAKYISKYKHFYTIYELGAGSFGKVNLVVKRSDLHTPYALKTMIIPTSKRLDSYYYHAIIEKEAMGLTVGSQHFVKIFASWIQHGYADKPDSFCILTEFMENGDLSTIIEQLYPSTTSQRNRVGADFNIELMYTTFLQNTEPWQRETGLLEFRQNAVRMELGWIRQNMRVKYMEIIVTFVKQLVDGIRFMHQKRIVHRDLKPENILVNGNFRLKLADFGLASPFHYRQDRVMTEWVTGKDIGVADENYTFLGRHRGMRDFHEQCRSFVRARDRLTRVEDQVGTYYYIPPELCTPNQAYLEIMHQNKPKIYPRKHFPHDVYSLGCIIYKLCNGIHPIQEEMRHRDSDISDSTDEMNIHSQIRLKPDTENHFLYHVAGTEFNPVTIFTDYRLLELIRLMLAPQLPDRISIQDLHSHPHYTALVDAYDKSDAGLPFVWNEFTTENMRRIGLEKFLEFRNQMETGQGAAYEEPTGDLDTKHRLQGYSLFSSVYYPMEIFATPVTPTGPATENVL